MVGLVAIATFGPYVVGGFRTEQIAVYATCAVLLAGAWWTKVRPNSHGTAVLALLAAQMLVAVIGAVAPPPNTTSYQLGNPLAGIDNLALPIAILGIVWMLLAAGADRDRLIRLVCTVTTWAMVTNSGLAVWAAGGKGPDLSIFQGQSGVESVAFRAEQLGRYSGIFNQPAEAGLMYSIALLGAIYLYRERARMLAITATAISIGGVLTVSKVFLFAGLPVGMWHALRSAGGRQRRIGALLAVIVVAWAAAKSGLAPEWTGGKFLLRLLPGGDQSTVALYTAGRFGGQSSLSTVVNALLASSPVWGFGAGGLLTAYDNAWVEALAMGGVFGAAIFTAVLVILVHAWWSKRQASEPGETRLAGGLVAVVIGAAVGVPSLTCNRCATIVWVLLGLLLLSRKPDDHRVNQFVPLV